LSDASNNIDWRSYEAIAAHPAVAWSIPLSLGDSHRGFRVVGTTREYLEHLRYGRKQSLRILEGEWFANPDGCVLGSQVAAALDYAVGDEIVVAHGAGDVSFIEHDEHPFMITGILAPTGTPVDRSVHVSLHGIDAIHAGMLKGFDEEEIDPLAAALKRLEQDSGGQGSGPDDDHGHHQHLDHSGHDHEPERITAFLVGLKSRSAVLDVQRMVNEFEAEPLSAVLPGAALQQLWEVVGEVERALMAISGFVVVVGLAGMLVAIMTSLNERRREMAILRSVGARPAHVFALIMGEAALVTTAGIVSGFALVYALTVTVRPILMTRFGLSVAVSWPNQHELGLALVVLLAGIVIGLLPAYRSYRLSLNDGLTARV
jgi:putative ABC transport system permease protein